MSKDTIERVIRTLKQRTHSVADQVKILHALWKHSIGPTDEGFRAAETEGVLNLDLEYDPGTSLGHLKDIGLVDTYFKSHNEWHPVAQWKGDDGEIVFGDELDAAIREAIDALIDQMNGIPESGESAIVADGGATTVRSVVADAFDYEPEKIEDYLREHNEDVDTLNKAVQAVKESDDVSTTDDYGEIDFIPRAYYYRLAQDAVDLYER